MEQVKSIIETSAYLISIVFFILIGIVFFFDSKMYRSWKRNSRSEMEIQIEQLNSTIEEFKEEISELKMEIYSIRKIHTKALNKVLGKSKEEEEEEEL